VKLAAGAGYLADDGIMRFSRPTFRREAVPITTGVGRSNVAEARAGKNMASDYLNGKGIDHKINKEYVQLAMMYKEEYRRWVLGKKRELNY